MYIPYEKAIKAYKITDNTGTCCPTGCVSPVTYKQGEKYHYPGQVVLCKAGFHASRHPLDTATYHSITQVKYWEVKCWGEIIEESDKLVCSDIEIINELSRTQWINAATTGDKAHTATTGNKAHAATTGDNANAATTGYAAHAVTTGDYAHAATTGNKAHAVTTGYTAHAATTGHKTHAATTGDAAHAATTGNAAHAATTGNAAHAATTGHYAHAATTGHRAHAATTGEEAIAIAIGLEGIAQVHSISGWIILADWREAKIQRIVTAKPGDIVDGISIEVDKQYSIIKGKLQEVE